MLSFCGQRNLLYLIWSFHYQNWKGDYFKEEIQQRYILLIWNSDKPIISQFSFSISTSITSRSAQFKLLIECCLNLHMSRLLHLILSNIEKFHHVSFCYPQVTNLQDKPTNTTKTKTTKTRKQVRMNQCIKRFI